MIGGSGNILIGDTHIAAPLSPPLPIIGLPLVQFKAIGVASGKAISKQVYELETAERRIFKGQTNAQGITQSVATRQPDLAVVRWIA